MSTLRVALFALALCACGAGSDRNIVGPRHVAASSGAPDIAKVVDLGDLASLPSKGNLSAAASDGVFVVGELVLIEGDDFGKLPTIMIGGKPAKSLARTKAGGIVTRIPTEVAAGPIAIEVSHPEGRDTKTIEVSRYLAVATPDAVQLASVQADGTLALATSLAQAGIADLCFGHDGQALYLAVPGEQSLRAVAVAAKGGAALLPSKYRMGDGEFLELACRSGVPVIAALKRKTVLLYDARVPTALSELASIALPHEAVAAALSPDGESLAVLTRDTNSVLLISLKNQLVVSTLPLLGDETVPLLQDLVFAPAGDELWIVSGNSADSVVAGTRPTVLHRVAVHGISLSRTGSATIGESVGPRHLAVSQREAIMAAAAIRSTAQKATLLLTSVDDGVSRLLRCDLNGKTVAIAEGGASLSRGIVSHDQKWAYAAAWSAKGMRLMYASLTGESKRELSVPGAVPAGAGATAPKTIPLSIAP